MMFVNKDYSFKSCLYKIKNQILKNSADKTIIDLKISVPELPKTFTSTSNEIIEYKINIVTDNNIPITLPITFFIK